MKAICIDDFKPEYLKYAPYLRSLTKKYQWGRLKTPLGYWGAMEEFFNGESSDILAYYYYSKKSSLIWTKYWPFDKYSLFILINIIRKLTGKEYFIARNIPTKKIYIFDTIKPKHKPKSFEYIHIDEIDKIGHKYGTDSREIIKAIKEVDIWLSNQSFDLVFSDHGMINIKKIISVPETDKCFIDSTMARYWGKAPKLPLDYGKIISWPNKKYGETIFLANPGVLILPNYWQGNKSVKGMHGYNPNHKDMHGFYILKKKGRQRNLNMKQLHSEFNRYIKLKTN